LGNVVAKADVLANVTGLVGTTALGSANVQQGAGTDPVGVVGTTVLGVVSVTADAIIPETGLQATSALGNVTVELLQAVNVASVTGTLILGQTSENGQGTIELGTVLVWSEIVPSGNPYWTEVIAA
jgi:hypothetical protein